MAGSQNRLRKLQDQLLHLVRRGRLPAVSLTVVIASFVGVAAGVGAVAFSELIHQVSRWTVELSLVAGSKNSLWYGMLCVIPALGLLFVAWFTRRFAPEAQGHGVPEVIAAVARHDGEIRPRVSIVKILASGFCIGTGGSVGREGPIVQIGSSLGSVGGQFFRMSPRHIKVLVAAGAAAGISATFHAPIAGVIFASEIILGSFAVESLTPIVIASVLADVVQLAIGEHGGNPAFRQLNYQYLGAWDQLPPYLALGLLCGLSAVGFTKLLYATEDIGKRVLPAWWLRALVCGALVGVAGMLYPSRPPQVSSAVEHRLEQNETLLPPVFGVGYEVVDHAVHIEKTAPLNDANQATSTDTSSPAKYSSAEDRGVRLEGRDELWAQLWWLLPLALLKPILTSITLAGGGSGGIFAPSLYIGAAVGGCFGLVCNLLFPGASAAVGVYAIVGMGAVVAGTTHGVLSAILIVYEMTDDYQIILPIMAAAGLASMVARLVDAESIYYKKLSRRGEKIARGHDMHRLDHIMVRDVMIRQFPTVRHDDNGAEIVRIARANPYLESLPVMDDDGKLTGIIRPEDLHRMLDSDIPPQLVTADDISLKTQISVSPHENLIEALRDFGLRDVETLPVEVEEGQARKLVGLLQRSDVMRRYRQEMLDRA